MALPANALTLVATLELELGLTTSPAAQTALLERLIGVVSDAIDRFCNRNFARAVVVDERVAGFGSRRLVVARTPLVSIQAVKLESAATIGSTETIDAAGYYLENAEAGFIVRKSGWENTAAISAEVQPAFLPGTEERAYLVSYTGGYILPAAGATRNLPFDLEQAAIMAAVVTYRGRGKYSKLVEETEASDARVFLDYVLPANARQLLNRYRRVGS